MGERKLTSAELAQRLRVSTRTISRWRERGIGPAFTRLPGGAVYLETDVLLWELRRRVEAKSDRVPALPEIQA